MNIFQLKCFISVAETLNFARAAEQLHITQPTVTHQIQSLENELNAKLFKRTTRSVTLTKAGESFIGDANQMIRISEQAKIRFATHYSKDIPVISIGCHGYQELLFVPDALRELEASFPNIHPDIQIVPFAHLYRLLEEERVDAILAFQENDTKKIPGRYQELKKIPIVMVCPKDYPLADRAELSYTDLMSEKLILGNPRKCPDIIAKFQGHLIQDCSPDTLYFSDSPEVALTLVKAGFGIAPLPRNLVHYDEAFTLIPIPEVEPLSFGIYYKTLRSNPILKEFVNITSSFWHKTDD